MSDDKPRPDDETQPVRPEGAATPVPEPAPASASASASEEPARPVARRGFRERLGNLRRTDGRDRSYGLAALVASALAGVIVGGLGLTAVHAITHDGPGDRFDRGGWMQQRDADDRGPGRGGMHGGPRGVPGQLQPTTPPEDDGSMTPDTSGWTSS